MKNLNILITGGGSGIGAALTGELSAEGHSVIICGRREKNLRQIAKTNKNISYGVCDVSDEESVVNFLDFVGGKFKHIDVIINGAGLFVAIGRFDKTDSKMWKKTFEINTFGLYLVTKHFLDLLLHSDVKKIINFSGGGAFGAFPNYSAYAVSKSAVVRFSETVAAELAELGVQVNCVAPGFVATDIHEATLKAGEETAGEHFKKTKEQLEEGSVPMEVVVNCVKFLISHDSDGLTGKTISASFDRWDTDVFKKSIRQITGSELYTMRRINLINLGEKDKLRKKLISL
jgi:NAD(P)-dependent dehydrogenase (short-subunit alcohol dehydrogenase family)